MIKLKDILTENSIKDEGIRLGPANPKVPVPLEVDFSHDDQNADVVLLNPPDDAVNIWRTSEPEVIVYSAIGFNENSVAFKNISSGEKHHRKDLIRSVIKRIDKSAINYNDLIKIIDKSIDRFDSLAERSNRYKKRVGGIQPTGQLTNLIVALPSHSQLNPLIVQRFQRKHKNLMSYGTFEKMMSDELVLDMEKVESEPSARKNKERIVKYYNALKRTHAGKPFEVKFITANFRRYFYNFLTFKHDPTHQAFNTLANGNIMLVDDTIGEGNTLAEAVRVLKAGQVVPNRVLCYAFLRDFK